MNQMNQKGDNIKTRTRKMDSQTCKIVEHGVVKDLAEVTVRRADTLPGALTTLAADLSARSSFDTRRCNEITFWDGIAIGLV